MKKKRIQRRAKPGEVWPITTVEKLLADRDRIKQYAWGYLILDAKGELVAKHVREHGSGRFIPVIAVLAPVVHGGVSIAESVIMEIGLERTRPYMSAEIRSDWRAKRDVIETVVPRTRVRMPTSDEYRIAWQAIEQVFHAYVVERVSRWEFPDRRWAKGFPAEPGARFTISKTDIPLYRQLLREDWRWRGERFRYSRADAAAIIMQRIKAKRFTDRQLRANLAAKNLASFMRSITLLERSFVMRSFAKRSREHFLLDAVMEVFDIRNGDETEEGNVLWGDPHAQAFPHFQTIRMYLLRDQKRTRQALNGVVGEVFLSQEERKRVFPDSLTWRTPDEREQVRERIAIQHEGQRVLIPKIMDDDIPW